MGTNARSKPAPRDTLKLDKSRANSFLHKYAEWSLEWAKMAFRYQTLFEPSEIYNVGWTNLLTRRFSQNKPVKDFKNEAEAKAFIKQSFRNACNDLFRNYEREKRNYDFVSLDEEIKEEDGRLPLAETTASLSDTENLVEQKLLQEKVLNVISTLKNAKCRAMALYDLQMLQEEDLLKLLKPNQKNEYRKRYLKQMRSALWDWK
jgi:hypothetical protein